MDVPITLELTGVMDEPLALIPAAAGWLVVGQAAADVPAVGPHASEQTLRAEDAIVRVLTTRATSVLPMRFGTCFENETALQNRMARFTADHLRTALERVRGCEQMTLRLFQPEAPAPEPRGGAASAKPGTAYLEQRAAALTTALPELLEPLRRALSQIVRAEIVNPNKRLPLIG